MIVSHPDDEALFGGAELLSHPKEYKVIALDHYNDHVRQKEFINSMNFIGIKEYEHWTGFKGGEDYNKEELQKELIRVLKERDYKKIVTHNKEGEYGHPRHRACHNLLANLASKNLWCFDKGKKLEKKMIQKKSELLKIYASQQKILEWFNPWYEKISKFR